MNRTKEAISDVFWQILEEKPYSKITVQNIVERCQVNRNTFYYHFKDIPDLAEYSIKAWTDQVIKNNCEFGSPINCLTPAVQELTKRKTAFIHIYRSSHREAFIRYLNEICSYIVQSYIDWATNKIALSPENKSTVIKVYKCIFVGIVLDWLDAGASYDLLGFCEKVCVSFAGSGKRALLGQEKAAFRGQELCLQ